VSSPSCQITVGGLEGVAALGWRGTEIEPLGGWLLRAAGGFTGRSNSALPLGDPGLPAGEAITRVEQWYAARGLSARFLLPLPDAGLVDRQLQARGWALGDVVRMLVAPVPGLAAAHAADRAAGRAEVLLDSRPDDAWVAAYHYRGGGLPPHAREVIENGDTLAFASVRDAAGRVLAIARGSVDADRAGVGWLGVTAVEVDPSVRRQGLGGLILRGLAGWAQGQGAGCCYLQVAAENAPALALYGGAGFTEHHTYQYRLAPA
jgi:N-acetylglutamate synthase